MVHSNMTLWPNEICDQGVQNNVRTVQNNREILCLKIHNNNIIASKMDLKIYTQDIFSLTWELLHILSRITCAILKQLCKVVVCNGSRENPPWKEYISSIIESAINSNDQDKATSCQSNMQLGQGAIIYQSPLTIFLLQGIVVPLAL